MIPLPQGNFLRAATIFKFTLTIFLIRFSFVAVSLEIVCWSVVVFLARFSLSSSEYWSFIGSPFSESMALFA